MQCCCNKDESAGGVVDVIFLSEHSMCLVIISVFTNMEIRRILKAGHWLFHWIWWLHLFVFCSTASVSSSVQYLHNSLPSLHTLISSSFYRSDRNCPKFVKKFDQVKMYSYMHLLLKYTVIDYFSFICGFMKQIHHPLSPFSSTEVIHCQTGIYWIINYFIYLILKALNQCQLINLPHDFMLISFP